MRELAQRLAEAGGLDPRVAEELSKAFGFDADALDVEAEPASAGELDSEAGQSNDPDSLGPLDPQIMEQLEQLLADADRENPEPGESASDAEDESKGPTT